MKSKVHGAFKRLLKNRTGAAEIVGSIMFLLILLFFFTNVYLWHDRATREMDDVLAEKMNSPVSIEWDYVLNRPVVTNNGGVNVALSRLWIITDANHYFIELELWVPAGATVDIEVSVPSGIVTFKILTNLGNMAACQYVPPETP